MGVTNYQLVKSWWTIYICVNSSGDGDGEVDCEGWKGVP